MTINKFLCAAALASFSIAGTMAEELPYWFDFDSAEVSLNYNASTNTIQIKLTPTDHITYKEDGEEKRMDIDIIDKVEIRRGGKDANGEYHNSTYVIKTYENIPGGKTQVYNDSDILPGERYVYYVRTYIGEDNDWPDANEIYTYLKPGEVTEFKAEAADDKGSLPVTLSGYVPSKTETGTALGASDLTAIVFIRAPYEFNHGGEFHEIGKIENPAPGASFRWEDTTAELNKAYSYGVYAQAGESSGETTLIMFRTGQDIPVAPVNLKVVNDMTSLHLTWDAVKDGANGGYVNPADITYNLYEYKKNAYPEPEVEVLLKEGITANEFVADFSHLSSPEYKNLRLRACTPAGESDYTAFDEQIAGNPASLPWKEDFNKLVNDWGGITGKHCWEISAYMNIGSPELYFTTYGIYYTDPYNYVGLIQYTGVDGDISDSENEIREGFVSAFYEKPDVDVMLSEPVAFSNTVYPGVTFKVYQLPQYLGSENYVEVFASAVDGEFVSLGKANCFSDTDKGQWATYHFAMPQLAGSEYGYIRFQANAGEFPAPVSIDDVEIDDYPGVSNLSYSVDKEKNDFTLTWNAPATDKKVEGYLVYVNGQVPYNGLLDDTVLNCALPDTEEVTLYVVPCYDLAASILGAPSEIIKIDNSGVGMILDQNGNRVIYTDAAGRIVTNPEKGLYIKITVNSDGTKTSEKVIR